MRDSPLADHRQLQLQRRNAQHADVVPAVDGLHRHLPLDIRQGFRKGRGFGFVIARFRGERVAQLGNNLPGESRASWDSRSL